MFNTKALELQVVIVIRHWNIMLLLYKGLRTLSLLLYLDTRTSSYCCSHWILLELGYWNAELLFLLYYVIGMSRCFCTH